MRGCAKLTSVGDDPAAGPGQATVQLRSESLGYDPNGDLTSVKDWNGNTANYTYDAAGELTSQVVPVTSSTSDTTSYGYDPAGNQTSVKDGNGNTTWTSYNPWNQPESVIEPATPAAPAAANRTWTTAYNPDGQSASVSQPGGINLAYTYNPLGEITGESGSGASAQTTAQTFGYDLDGRLTSASAPGGTDAYTYYANNSLKSASGPSGTSSYQYNNDGLVSSETDAAGTTAYTYDGADRLATEADPLTGNTLTYGYNANSQPISIGYSSGATQTLAYNPVGELASDKITASGTTLASETYGYDSDGNLTSEATGGLMTNASTTYGYNEADQLTSATTGGTPTDYAYDAAGNQTQDGGTSYAYNAQDQVTSSTAAAGTTDYGYTLSGALASMTPPGGSAQAYTSDAYGDQITAPGGIGYAHDALGRLVTRTAGAGSASLSYLGTSDTLASDGTSDYSYTPSGDLTSEQASGGSAYGTLSDLHGDVSAAFNPSSSSTTLGGSATYSPYGTPTKTGSSSNLGYQGDYVDPTTGLVEMGARWYNPSTGSFTSNDTIAGSPLSTTIDGNPYAYTSGDPLTETDPSGHLDWGDFNPITDIEGAATAIGAAGSSALTWAGAAATAGTTALLTGGFTLLSWAFPESTASGCQDVICGPIGNFGGSPAPTWSPVNPIYGELGGGGAGGTVVVTPVVYVPPPPPQDCYAGPAHTCTPPPAPESLLLKQHITTTFNLPSISELYKQGRDFGEGVKPSPSSNVSGAKAAPNENGTPGNSSDSSLTQLLHSQLSNFQPQIPTAGAPLALPPTPQRLAITAAPPRLAMTAGTASQAGPSTASGGSGISGGGGAEPPVGSSGACGPDDGGNGPEGELSPAAQAAAWQGQGAYPGVDAWENVTLKAGTSVYAGEPGVSGFFTTAEAAASVGNDATALNEGLQVAPRAGLYRPGLTEFRLTQDVQAARSTALANPQFGAGGLEQCFIPNWENVTEPVASTIMQNRAAK